jgi:uncharacterized protein
MSPDLGFLVLMLTQRCNLSCAYCYARAGASGDDMTYDLASGSIEKFTSPGQKMVVELAGGEPLLAFDVIEKLVERFAGQPGLHFALQTNGLLLDDEKLGFLVDHGVGLGLSLDGPPPVNDLTRGAGEKTVRALRLLDVAGVGINLTVVLTKHNVEHLPQFLLFLAAHPSVRVVNLDALRSLGRAEQQDLAPTPAQIEAMVPDMLATLAFINDRRWPALKVREVEQFLKRRSDITPQAYCLACKAKYAAVTPGGDVFPCSSLIHHEHYRAGETDSSPWSELQPLVRDWGLPPECATCPARFYCRGGCPARRIAATGSAGQKCALECALRRAIYRRMVA